MNRFGFEDFSFFYLCVGLKWKNETIRKKLENDIIENTKFFYNIKLIKNDKDKYKKAIEYKGFLYKSISKAASNLNISEKFVRRKLKNLDETDCNYVDSAKYVSELLNNEKAKPVYVDGVYYRSERYASQQTGASNIKASFRI